MRQLPLTSLDWDRLAGRRRAVAVQGSLPERLAWLSGLPRARNPVLLEGWLDFLG